MGAFGFAAHQGFHAFKGGADNVRTDGAQTHEREGQGYEQQ